MPDTPPRNPSESDLPCRHRHTSGCSILDDTDAAGVLLPAWHARRVVKRTQLRARNEARGGGGAWHARRTTRRRRRPHDAPQVRRQAEREAVGASVGGQRM